MSGFVVLNKNYEKNYDNLDRELINEINNHIINFFSNDNDVDEYKKKFLNLLDKNIEDIMDNSIKINIKEIKELNVWFQDEINPIKKDFITEVFFKELIEKLYKKSDTCAINHVAFTLKGNKNDPLMKFIQKLINSSKKIYDRSSTHFAGDGLPTEGKTNYIWNKIFAKILNKRNSTSYAKGIDFSNSHNINGFEINTLLIQQLLNKNLDDNITIFIKPESNGTNSLTGLFFHTIDLIAGQKNLSDKEISKKESCLNKELNELINNILKDSNKLKKEFKKLSDEYFTQGKRDSYSLLGMFIKNIIFSVLTVNQISNRSYIYTSKKYKGNNRNISKSLPKNFKKHSQKVNIGLSIKLGIPESKENNSEIIKNSKTERVDLTNKNLTEKLYEEETMFEMNI
jgi:hypothetical protein